MEVTIQVNGKEVLAEKGEFLLSVLRRTGIRVPTLCSMEGLSPSGACRLCVVEVEGIERLVPSCSYYIEGPISIATHSPRVMRARKTNVELLLANHPDDCLYCERNGSCELQALAEELNIRKRNLPGTKRNLPVDKSGPSVVRDPSKCILCGRCVRTCEEIMNTSVYDFASRGNELRISTALGKPLRFTNCISCGQCVISCPTGALTEIGVLDQLLDHLNHPGKQVAVQFTPAAAASVSSQLGIKPSGELPDLFRALLYRCGFDQVFESTTGTILMVMEMARLLGRRDPDAGSLPLITSSCPAWVRSLEHTDPELSAALAPLHSPQQILGRVIREQPWQSAEQDGRELVSVLVTSCTAAKSEAVDELLIPKGKPVIDLVVSAREMLKLVGILGIDIGVLEPVNSGTPLLLEGAPGRLSAQAGGEAEAVMRLLHLMKTGKHLNVRKFHRFGMQIPYREMTLDWGSGSLRVGAVSGLSQAAGVFREIREGKRKLDFLEVMACPRGCINGGGQPIPAGEEALGNLSRGLQEMEGGPRSSHPFPFARIGEFYQQMTGSADPGDRGESTDSPGFLYRNP
ncbi:MAG: [Fe-Fe] hydrogenase large subunit C-terminal domain-containing protein [Bacteroidales bacterium]